MCILFCYLQDETIDIGYELILLSNRDEDFQRPATPAHVWKHTKYALGGQDQTPLREGGTWLCLNTVQSKIGILLNLSSSLLEEKNNNAQSRGFIVPNYVNNSELNLDSYINELQKTKTNYTGFNFLGLERQLEAKKWRAKYLNNISSESLPTDIDTSIFGFSNHRYGDQYAFNKTHHGCQLLKTLLTDLTANYTKPITDEKELTRRAFCLLSDSTIFPDDPNILDVYSDYTIENRNQISSINVCTTPENPTYGTRSSTIIFVRRDQTGLFIERSLSNPLVNSLQWTQLVWSFDLNKVNKVPSLIN